MTEAATSIVQEKNSFGYEYTDVIVPYDMKSVYADAYEHFGWQLERSIPSLHHIGSINLRFKRDRKIRNKAELTRLQRQFDACAKEVASLERSKVTGPATAAYIAGIAGTGFLAGATFCFLAGMVPLCVILAIPGFAGWAVSYFLYLRLKAKRNEKVTPLIDGKYDEMYELCEKAHGLMA